MAEAATEVVAEAVGVVDMAETEATVTGEAEEGAVDAVEAEAEDEAIASTTNAE